MVAAVTDARTQPPRTWDRFETGQPGAAARALRAQEAAGRQADSHDPAVVRQAAAQLMSELFFGPLLAEMRRFPFGRELTAGGPVEAVFGAQLDQRIADGVAAADTGLMKQMLRQLEPKGPAAAATRPAGGSPPEKAQETTRRGAV